MCCVGVVETTKRKILNKTILLWSIGNGNYSLAN